MHRLSMGRRASTDGPNELAAYKLYGKAAAVGHAWAVNQLVNLAGGGGAPWVHG